MTAVDLATVVALLAAAVFCALIASEARRRRRDRILLSLLATLGPAVAAGRTDPERLVAWSEVARAARALFPEAFARLDAAGGGSFPFSRAAIAAAHARWTADWLAWERRHDLEFKQRAAAVEAELAEATGGEAEQVRARLAAVNQEKLQTYQDRYEHYVRVGKAIAALEDRSGGGEPRPAGRAGGGGPAG